VTAIKHILFFLALSLGCYAQSDSLDLRGLKAKDLNRLGKSAMQQGDPNSAVTYLEASLKQNKNDRSTQFNLAEAYRATRNYEAAEKLYASAYEGNPGKYPQALYYRAQMQKSMGQYDKAKESFSKFKKEYKGSDKMLKRSASREIVFCDSAKVLQLNERKIVVQHLEGGINKVNVEASPLSLDENTMIYSSLRTDKKEYVMEGDTNNALVRKLYVAKKNGNDWTYEGEWGESFNEAGYNTGNATLTPDGKRLYFTRCKPNWQGKMICAIYVSENENGSWSEPVKLPKTINNPKYSNSQPAVSIDPVKKTETVFFVSERKNGKGGQDIWYFVYDAKKKLYKTPRNAGSKINTAKDEMTPFFDNETRTLFFSSEGWGGLGGLDVFKAVGDGKKWLSVENMGQPINSGADDIYYSISKNREEGFLVSNRKGSVALKNATCCDDIYLYKQTQYIHVNITGTIYDEAIQGANRAVPGATLELYSKDRNTGEKFLIKTAVADDKGHYDIKVEAGSNYELVVKKTDYLSGSQQVSTREVMTTTTIEKDIPLKKEPKDPIRIPNVQYEFDRSELTAASKIAIDTSILVLLQNNPLIIVELASHTDSRGNDNYNLKLSQKRAESVVNYLISKGIPAERIKPKGYGETRPVAPNDKPDGSDNPEGRALNRRTDFRIIGKLDVEILNNGKDEDED